MKFNLFYVVTNCINNIKIKKTKSNSCILYNHNAGKSSKCDAVYQNYSVFNYTSFSMFSLLSN